MLQTILGWIALNEAAHRLRQLDDRLLADMGVARADIGRQVRGAAAPAAEAGTLRADGRPARPAVPCGGDAVAAR